MQRLVLSQLKGNWYIMESKDSLKTLSIGGLQDGLAKFEVKSLQSSCCASLKKSVPTFFIFKKQLYIFFCLLLWHNSSLYPQRCLTAICCPGFFQFFIDVHPFTHPSSGPCPIQPTYRISRQHCARPRSFLTVIHENSFQAVCCTDLISKSC